jgi:hypothetical protein
MGPTRIQDIYILSQCISCRLQPSRLENCADKGYPRGKTNEELCGKLKFEIFKSCVIKDANMIAIHAAARSAIRRFAAPVRG